MCWKGWATMTSQHTFENTFHQRLLDLLYGQWGTLGAPFSSRGPSVINEVVDPEALLWCSLEFLPTEPRLYEAVSEWILRNKDYLVRQRVYKIRDRKDPRAIIWQALDRRATKKIELPIPAESCYGLDSPAEVLRFARSIEESKLDRRFFASRLGRKGPGSTTILLKARDLLGHDIRHSLLIYLLANSRGGKLRDAQAWSGYSYRSLSDAAVRWETADILTINSGYCRLTASDPFRSLLRIHSEQIVLVNWLTIFGTSIRLLRDLAKARKKGFTDNSTVIKTLQREAVEKLESPDLYSEKLSGTSVEYLVHGSPPEPTRTAAGATELANRHNPSQRVPPR
jgi:hypothetical protein